MEGVRCPDIFSRGGGRVLKGRFQEPRLERGTILPLFSDFDLEISTGPSIQVPHAKIRVWRPIDAWLASWTGTKFSPAKRLDSSSMRISFLNQPISIFLGPKRPFRPHLCDTARAPGKANHAPGEE